MLISLAIILKHAPLAVHLGENWLCQSSRESMAHLRRAGFPSRLSSHQNLDLTVLRVNSSDSQSGPEQARQVNDKVKGKRNSEV